MRIRVTKSNALNNFQMRTDMYVTHLYTKISQCARSSHIILIFLWIISRLCGTRNKAAISYFVRDYNSFISSVTFFNCCHLEEKVRES